MESINYQTLPQSSNLLQLPPQSQSVMNEYGIGTYEPTQTPQVENQNLEVSTYVPVETQTLTPVEVETKVPMDFIETNDPDILSSGTITKKKLVPLRISRMVPEETEIMVPMKVKKMVRKTSEILVPMFEKTEKVLHIPKNAEVELPPSFKNYKTKTTPNFQSTFKPFEIETSSQIYEPVLSQNDIQNVLNEANVSSSYTNAIDPTLTSVPSTTQTEIPPLSDAEINQILNEANLQNQTGTTYDINPEIYSQTNNFTTSIPQTLPASNVELGVPNYQSFSLPNFTTNQIIPQTITKTNYRPVTVVRRSLSVPKISQVVLPTSQPNQVTNINPINIPPVGRTIYNIQSMPNTVSAPFPTSQGITPESTALPTLTTIPTSTPIVRNSLFQPIISTTNRGSIRRYSITSVNPLTFTCSSNLPLTETLPTTNTQTILPPQPITPIIQQSRPLPVTNVQSVSTPQALPVTPSLNLQPQQVPMRISLTIPTVQSGQTPIASPILSPTSTNITSAQPLSISSPRLLAIPVVSRPLAMPIRPLSIPIVMPLTNVGAQTLPPQGIQQLPPQGVQPLTPQGVQQLSPQGVQPLIPQGVQQLPPQGVQPLTPQGIQQLPPKGVQPLIPQGVQQLPLQGIQPLIPQGIQQLPPQGVQPLILQGVQQLPLQGIQPLTPQGVQPLVQPLGLPNAQTLPGAQRLSLPGNQILPLPGAQILTPQPLGAIQGIQPSAITGAQPLILPNAPLTSVLPLSTVQPLTQTLPLPGTQPLTQALPLPGNKTSNASNLPVTH